MRTSNVIIRFCFAMAVACCAMLTYAKELSLPKHMPELKVTEQKQLGTLAPGFGAEVGSQIVNFTIKDHFGNDFEFASFNNNKALMVIFYRGGWCPHCNRQIYELTQASADFEKRGITPVLISVDTADAAALASRTYDIPFPVLSDPNLKAHNAFKVAMDVNPDTLARMAKFGISLSDWSGQTHNKIAVSSAFIVGKESRVLWAHSDLDYTKRPSVQQLLDVIDTNGVDF